mmetsp:Transcript_14730/g.26158  ORF Transcript_14730/g.26158 Transcript_14730/m.26158 type:complete len:86 (+) Transcript_14730:62-319(+)
MKSHRTSMARMPVTKERDPSRGTPSVSLVPSGQQSSQLGTQRLTSGTWNHGSQIDAPDGVCRVADGNTARICEQVCWCVALPTNI